MYDCGINASTGKRIVTACVPRFRTVSEPDFFVPCGKCDACLEDRRKDWIVRLQCETFTNPLSSFITLTYDNEHLPVDGLVCKSDVQRFIKRLRNVGRDYDISIPSFKYFIGAEYGSRFHRPHYHGILFGCDLMSPEWRPSFVSLKGSYPVFTSGVLSEIWSNGYVSCAAVSPSDIYYTAKYIKKASSDRSLFYLFSRGIGRDWFYDSSTDSLRPSAYDAYSGKFVVRNRRSFFPAKVPSFVDRLFDRLDPDFLAHVKTSRRDFMMGRAPDFRSADERLSGIHERRRFENERRFLDGQC